jgi:hypothetical protein
MRAARNRARFAGILKGRWRFPRHLREAALCSSGPAGLIAAVVVLKEWEVVVARSTACKPSCEACFFSRNGLCALPEREPCVAFRPDHPEGLRPPQQLRFVFRAERRARATWAFPTAQEQAALHAH